MILDLKMKFLGYDTKSTVAKRKTRSVGLHQKYKLLCMKGHYQSKKRIHGMGETIYKLYNC